MVTLKMFSYKILTVKTVETFILWPLIRGGRSGEVVAIWFRCIRNGER